MAYVILSGIRNIEWYAISRVDCILLQFTNFQSYTKYIVSQTNSTLTGVFDFFTIYDPSVWIGIFVCFILVMLIYFIICQIGSKLIIKESTSIGNVSYFVSYQKFS
jgi:hypothetical protein